MIDRFDCRRHHAIISRNHEDHDVSCLGTARAHGGEGFVAWRIDEGDLLAVDFDLIGANVLGDPARFAGDDIGFAQRIEQGGLAVVDVTHDRDDRCTCHQRIFRIG